VPLPNWIQDRFPAWLHGPVAWLLEPAVLSGVAIASAALFVLSAAGVPWFVARVPTDYFSRRELEQMHIAPAPRSLWRVVGRVLKNLLGLVLVLAGIAMVFLPGQGLLTIFVGLLLLEFPGKRRLERRLIGWGPIYRAINGLRRRAGRPPLERGSWG
jgi:hypothetical protein